MQITRIKFTNHPILSNLELNFCDEQGKPYNTVIFAGENGCGKTTILKFISDLFKNMHVFLNQNLDFDFSIDFYLSQQEQDNIKNTLRTANIQFDNTKLSEAINITYNHNAPNVYERVTSNFLNQTHFTAIVSHIYVCFYSVYLNTDINFQTENIKSISSTGLDRDLNKIRNMQPWTIANDLKQLFIDIYAQDSEELSLWCKEHPGSAPSTDIISKRISRFTDAFSIMFKNIFFKNIQTINETKQVVFTKQEKDVLIDDLSSGEKQIVFRGSYVLRDISSIKSEVLLIDEPEISMHPKWQNKILDFYKQLIIDETGNQSSQLFVATHSEHIIKNAYQKGDLILVLSNSGSEINVKPIQDLKTFSFSPTYPEIKYFAFNISSIEFHDELYGYIKEMNNLVQEKDVENFFLQKREKQTKKWARLKNNIFNTPEEVTLMTYIRNVIHHPEAANKTDNPLGKCNFTDEELAQSIGIMLDILKS